MAKAFQPYPPLPELEIGDVLLYAPAWHNAVGLIIAVKTWTALSHAESYAGRGLSYGARIEGVDVWPVRIDRYLRYIRRPVLPPGRVFDEDAAWRAIAPMLGKPYQVSGFGAFFAPWSRARRASRICSVLSAYHLRGGGCEVFNPDLEEADVAPAQLYQTPGLRTIWERKKRKREAGDLKPETGDLKPETGDRRAER